MPEETRESLNTDEENRVFETFRTGSLVGATWSGFYGIFRNNRLVCFSNTWYWGSRSAASGARNQALERVSTVKAPGNRDPHAIIVLGVEIPLFGPLNVHNYSQWTDSTYSNNYDIRRRSPDLFRRLQELFPTREILTTDLTNIGLNLAGEPVSGE